MLTKEEKAQYLENLVRLFASDEQANKENALIMAFTQSEHGDEEPLLHLFFVEYFKNFNEYFKEFDTKYTGLTEIEEGWIANIELANKFYKVADGEALPVFKSSFEINVDVTLDKIHNGIKEAIAESFKKVFIKQLSLPEDFDFKLEDVTN